MKKIQFSIDRLEHIGNNQFLIGGRNYRDSIHLSDILKLQSNEEIILDNIKIEKFRYYENEVNEIEHGMVAGIILKNEHVQLFHLGAELTN